MSSSKKIADRLKTLRQVKGLTQAQVAGNASISTNYYAKVERGEQSPTLDTFESIVNALGAKSSEILPF